MSVSGACGGMPWNSVPAAGGTFDLPRPPDSTWRDRRRADRLGPMHRNSASIQRLR